MTDPTAAVLLIPRCPLIEIVTQTAPLNQSKPSGSLEISTRSIQQTPKKVKHSLSQLTFLTRSVTFISYHLSSYKIWLRARVDTLWRWSFREGAARASYYFLPKYYLFFLSGCALSACCFVKFKFSCHIYKHPFFGYSKHVCTRVTCA